jgi:hypothetical protein
MKTKTARKAPKHARKPQDGPKASQQATGPLTPQQRRAAELVRAKDNAAFHSDKLLSGPDPTEARLANSPYRESSLMALHYSPWSGRVDADGTPSMRTAVVRALDNALLDTEDGHRRHAGLEALRTSPKRSHRRAWSILLCYYGGMTQAEIAETAGTGGKRITQGRVSQIITSALRLLQASP